MHVSPPDSVRAAVEAFVGSPSREWRAVTGGHTSAGRARVFFDDRSVFAKWAEDERTAGFVRAEFPAYELLAADFMPACHLMSGDAADGHPLLVLEDLGSAHWPPPWSVEQARCAVETLRRVHACAPPEGLGTLESYRDELSGWKRVEQDPEPFLGIGLASRGWLDAALPTLLAAEAATPLDGNDLLHFDARGDNLCFTDDGRVVLIDWNWACVGNGALDVAILATSIAADGGPQPEDLLRDDGGTATILAGFWASMAGLPPPDETHVRRIQLHCLRSALPWTARVLGLPEPFVNRTP